MSNELKYVVQVDNKGAIKSLKDVGSESEGMANKSGKSLELMKAKYLAVAAAAAVVVGALVKLNSIVNEVVDLGDKLGKLSTRLGVPVNELDKLRRVADLSGVSFDTLTNNMARMTTSIGQVASGVRAATGPVNTALESLNLSAKELVRLNPQEQLLAIAKEIEKISDPSKRIEITRSLGLTPEVLQMVDGLATNLSKVNSQWSQERARQMEAYKDTLTRINFLFEDLKVELVVHLLPHMQKFLIWFEQWMGGEGGNIESWVEGLSESILTLRTILEKFGIVELTTIEKLTSQRKELAEQVENIEKLLTTLQPKTRLGFVNPTYNTTAQLLAKKQAELFEVEKELAAAQKEQAEQAEEAQEKWKKRQQERIDGIKREQAALEDKLKIEETAAEGKAPVSIYDVAGKDMNAHVEAWEKHNEDIRVSREKLADRLVQIDRDQYIKLLQDRKQYLTADEQLLDWYYEELEQRAYGDKDLLIEIERLKQVELMRILKESKEAQMEWDAVEFEESLKRYEQILENFSIQAAHSVDSAFKDTFKSLIKGTESFTDAMLNMLDRLADAMLDFSIQLLEFNIFGEGGLKGQLFGAAMGLAGGMTTGPTPGGSALSIGQTSGVMTAGGFAQPWGGANGTVFPGGFQAFASGGIVNRPTLGLVGEGTHNEAIIPLPDGRNVPVKLQGDQSQGGGPTIIIQAMDTQSFTEFARRNPDAFAAVIADMANKGHGGFRNSIQKATR